MSKPVLLDLFCGAGGAAMGYHRAGFDVVGVDIAPQPRYPFEFHQADALTFPLDGFDAIHASPPCQPFCALKVFASGKHPDLIQPMYARLMASGLPFVMENSPRAPMPGATVLCGTMFDLSIQRHRAFWSNILLFVAGSCRHSGHELVFSRTHEGVYRAAMGVEWMTQRASRQAIPPAYTEWLGRQLLTALDAGKVA